MALLLGLGISVLGIAGLIVRKIYQSFNSHGNGTEEAERENHGLTVTRDSENHLIQDDLNRRQEVQQDAKEAKDESVKQSPDDAVVVQNQEAKTIIDFETNPTFVKTIRTKARENKSKAIFGLSVLNQELFIICQHSSIVEVYDSMSLNFKHQFDFDDLYDPIDIKSCSSKNCLYIIDWEDEESSEIVRIKSNGKLITRWESGGGGGYILITPEATVLLSVWKLSILKEFTAEGRFIRQIQLHSSIVELRLAVTLPNGHFIISQGEDEQSEHRVCLVDDKGAVVKSIGGKQGSSNGEFHSPNYLVVDRSGFILVADQNNRRVVLLSPDLEFEKEVIQERDDLRYPVRMDLDRASGRLFVADNDYLEDQTGWRDGRVKAFDFKINQFP